MWKFNGRSLQLSSMALLMLMCLAVADGAASMSRRTNPVFGPFSAIKVNSRYEIFHKHHSFLTAAVRTRGGSDSDAEDDEESDLDDEDGAFDELEAGEDGDDDFLEATYVDRFVDAYQKSPPLTKGYLAASFIVTFAGFFFNKNQFPEILLLDWKKVLRGQIWRPFTTFLNFGPFGIGYGLTLQFVWTYMSTLERLHHRKPYDFWIMIVFGMMSMVAGYPILKLNARFLGHNLSTFLVYMWSRYHEGSQVKIFELYMTRAEVLPWFFLAQTFLLEGEPPILDFLGIVFGHVYHHLNTAGMLRAPPALVEWYKESESPFAQTIRQKYKEISSDFEVI